MNRLLELGEKNREVFVTSQKGKTLKVLIEKYSSTVIPVSPVIPAKAEINKIDKVL